MVALARWLVLAFCLLAAPALAEKRVALVVANADYAGAPLSNPIVDARLVRDALSRIGFDVTVAENASFDVFDESLSDFQSKARNADIALFYFAGHGFAVLDEGVPHNYLMAVDANVTARSERALARGGIRLDAVIDGLADGAETTLVFVDACRNDPRVSRALGGRGRGLARVGGTRGKNLFVGLSTRPGEVAADGEANAGSPFARAFAANIGTAGARLDDAFTSVRLQVEQETNDDQSPESRNDLRAPVVLVAPSSVPAPTVTEKAEPAPSACADARDQYEEAKLLGTAGAFRAFVKANPNCSPYVDFALEKVAALEQVKVNPSPQPTPDGTDWSVSILQPEPPVVGPKPANPRSAPETECDRVAANPSDHSRRPSVQGVAYVDLNVKTGLLACGKALKQFPREPRLHYQLGRVLENAGQYAEAQDEYREAASGGYAFAMCNLAVMYDRGQGVEQDSGFAEEWTLKAQALGVACGGLSAR